MKLKKENIIKKKINWKETSIENAISIFAQNGVVKCIIPEEFMDEAFEICDEGDGEYIFNKVESNGEFSYDGIMPLTKNMICHGKWYILN